MGMVSLKDAILLGAYAFQEDFKKQTERTAYKMVFDENKKTTIFDSKILGIPYWDLTKEYPTYENNKKMDFLFQVNLSKENIDNGLLPKEGILQVFLGNKIEIVYHKTVDESVTENQILEIYKSNDYDVIGFSKKELPFSLEKTKIYMNQTIKGYRKLMSEAIEKKICYISFDEVESSIIFEMLRDEADDLHISLGEEILESFRSYCNLDRNETLENESTIFGYEYIDKYYYYGRNSDEDNKEETEDEKKYNTLLFKISCESNENISIHRTLNIFINDEKLKNLDFSDVSCR